MKILLTSIGTRGDMEPFIAIGQMLKKKDHEVICMFPAQFEDLVHESQLRFASLGSEFIDMLDSDIGKAALGGGQSGLRKIIAFLKLAYRHTKINKLLVERQYEIIEKEKPDRIIHNGKAMYPVIWGINNPGKNIQISPVPYLHYVKGHSHVAFNSNYGSFLNKLTFKIADFGLIQTLLISRKWLNLKNEISKKAIKKSLRMMRVIYTISPSLFPRSEGWSENMKVLGYQKKIKTKDWQPEKELVTFLEKNDKILFVTFGSMTNPSPESKTKVVLNVLSDLKIPAIVNTASGGLVKPKYFTSDCIYFVEKIPYDFIFSKVYAIVHHGGSGTTHLALQNGLPTLIIPHIIDQFVWKKMVYEKGLGPKGIKIGKITEKNLKAKIEVLYKNELYKRNAISIAESMNQEDYELDLYNEIIRKY